MKVIGWHFIINYRQMLQIDSLSLFTDNVKKIRIKALELHQFIIVKDIWKQPKYVPMGECIPWLQSKNGILSSVRMNKKECHISL